MRSPAWNFSCRHFSGAEAGKRAAGNCPGRAEGLGLLRGSQRVRQLGIQIQVNASKAAKSERRSPLGKPEALHVRAFHLKPHPMHMDCLSVLLKKQTWNPDSSRVLKVLSMSFLRCVHALMRKCAFSVCFRLLLEI